jgi:hypothetical protein
MVYNKYIIVRGNVMILDPISEKIGTGPENIRVIENFIEEEDRLALLEFCKKYDGDKITDRFYPIHVTNEIKAIQIKYTRKMFDSITEFYKDKSPVLYPRLPEKDDDLMFIPDKWSHLASFLCHPPTSFMHPHVDIVGYVQVEGVDVPDYKERWTGHLSSVIYLNDDYEGGELIFPDRDIEIKPKAGMFIGFPGNKHYMHGVKEVIGSDRYTFSLWARFEEAYKHDIFDSGIEN